MPRPQQRLSRVARHLGRRVATSTRTTAAAASARDEHSVSAFTPAELLRRCVALGATVAMGGTFISTRPCIFRERFPYGNIRSGPQMTLPPMPYG
jgi:hypothetical protein